MMRTGAGSDHRAADDAVSAAPVRMAHMSIASVKRSDSSRLAFVRPFLMMTWAGMSRQ